MSQVDTNKITSQIFNLNTLDPYLASIYPVYSLVSHMVNPFMECGQEIPSSLPFKVDISYVPEGEEDQVQIDILHHFKEEIIMFLWKTMDKAGDHLCLRHRNSTWKLKIAKINLFQENEMRIFQISRLMLRLQRQTKPFRTRK